MMKEMRMVAVETTEDGYIHIVQEGYMYDGVEISIEVSPDQVGLMTSWLHEAARYLERGGDQ